MLNLQFNDRETESNSGEKNKVEEILSSVYKDINQIINEDNIVRDDDTNDDETVPEITTNIITESISTHNIKDENTINTNTIKEESTINTNTVKEESTINTNTIKEDRESDTISEILNMEVTPAAPIKKVPWSPEEVETLQTAVDKMGKSFVEIYNTYKSIFDPSRTPAKLNIKYLSLCGNTSNSRGVVKKYIRITEPMYNCGVVRVGDRKLTQPLKERIPILEKIIANNRVLKAKFPGYTCIGFLGYKCIRGGKAKHEEYKIDKFTKKYDGGKRIRITIGEIDTSEGEIRCVGVYQGISNEDGKVTVNKISE